MELEELLFGSSILVLIIFYIPKNLCFESFDFHQEYTMVVICNDNKMDLLIVKLVFENDFEIF